MGFIPRDLGIILRLLRHLSSLPDDHRPMRAYKYLQGDIPRRGPHLFHVLHLPNHHGYTELPYQFRYLDGAMSLG